MNTFFATQGAKPNLSSPTPPALDPDVFAAVAGFGAVTSPLGRNEYESGTVASPGPLAGTLNFSYTGGTATFAGSASIVDNISSTPDNGRYNMTANIPPNPATGDPRWGHWLESAGEFSYSFSTPVTAMAFFGTDFGDLGGTFELIVYSGTTVILDTFNITNNEKTKANGNLLFFGMVSDVAFDKAVFRTTQKTGITGQDILGFDSLIVASRRVGVSLPEPGSMALVGAALLAAGAAGRKRKAH